VYNLNSNNANNDFSSPSFSRVCALLCAILLANPASLAMPDEAPATITKQSEPQTAPDTKAQTALLVAPAIKPVNTNKVQNNKTTSPKSIPDAKDKPVTKRLKLNAVAPEVEEAPPIKPKPQEPEQAEAPNLPKTTYPALDELEQFLNGFVNVNLSAGERIDTIERDVYKRNFPNLALSRRVEQLQETLFGYKTGTPLIAALPPAKKSTSVPPNKTPYPQDALDAYKNAAQQNAAGQINQRQQAGLLATTSQGKEDPAWREPFYQENLPIAELEKFGLELINQKRLQLGYAPLEPDKITTQVAQEHVRDLTERSLASHYNKSGENPDLRYTKSGGSDALNESVIALVSGNGIRTNRAAVAKLISLLDDREDDREAILSSRATHGAFALGYTSDKKRLIGCAEVVSRHAIMHPIPREVNLGEKVEVKGVILQPYHFHRITLSYEGINPALSEIDNDNDEALPYFPPLEYIAYGEKAEHDHAKSMAAIKTLGIIAAIAGGMVIPPVALAAPAIAMIGNDLPTSAALDIPIKGGIKLDGAIFSGKIPINKDNKEGLYYLMVWATTANSSTPIVVSRRIIIARDPNAPKVEPKPPSQPESGNSLGQTKSDEKK
jgi:uncharacterized protein YkwD